MYENPLWFLSQPGRFDADKFFEGQVAFVTDLDEVNDVWHYREGSTQYIIEIIKIYAEVTVQQ